MPPRSVSSSPNLSVSRKVNDADPDNSESLPSSIQPGKLSVIQRVRDLDQRAAAEQQKTVSNNTSPPLASFIKNPTIGAQFVISQSVSRRPSTAPAHNQTPISVTDKNNDSNDGQILQLAVVESNVQFKSEENDQLVPEKRGLVPDTEGSSEEEYDETPRQSTNYSNIPKKIIRHDSSRQANYSLKPRTYSPDPVVEGKRLEPTDPPRLPKLFFQGTNVVAIESQKPEQQISNFHYLTPGQETQENGYTKPAEDKIAPSTPGPQHSGQMVESPPLDDEMDASNRSFFWYSPHDSTDETDDEELPANRYSNVQSISERHDTLTSATALEFGGPSDWEHFYGGDYETAELIDDTDLYLSKEKEKYNTVGGKRPVKTEELAKTVGAPQLEEQLAAESRAREIPPLPTIEESQESEDTNIVTQHADYNLNLDDFARSPPPVTPAAPPTPAAPTQTEVNSVRAVTISDSRPPGDKIQSDDAITHKVSQETIIPDRNQKCEPGEAADRQSMEDEGSLIMRSVAGTPFPVDMPPSRTPPPTEITMPDSKIRSNKDLASGPSSPSADDPNASEITISMVLPPDFDPVSPTSLNTASSKASPPLKVADSRKSVFPQGEELPNPYAGLSPMAKASLNRFIRMVREEERTESDHDKYFVFINFARREMKLRATLYDMDDESELSLPPSTRASLISPGRRKGRSSSTTRRIPLPASAEATIAIDPTIGRTQSMLASGAGIQPEESFHSKPIAVRQSTLRPPTSIDKTPTVLTNEVERATEQTDNKITDEAVEIKCQIRNLSHQTSLETLNKSVELVAPRWSIISDHVTASSLTKTSIGKPASERPVNTASPLPGAQILEQSLSVRLNESRPYDGDKATNRQSIYRPFSGMLRSSNSHRRASVESDSTVKSADKISERKKTDLCATTDASSHIIKARIASQPNSSQTGRQPSAYDQFFAVIPHTNMLREEHRQLANLRFDMDSIFDDFSFIHKTVLEWDSGAKVKRERYEQERQQRLSDNERRLDELFNDNEIGYGDISHLEAEFKRTDSAKKAEEEREEVDSFVSSVFDAVWTRINYEIDRLTPLYQEATKLVTEASAGKQMFEETDERVPIAPIMEILLILYQKLMIRHQKAFEAVLERDRRLKKTEVSPWFALDEFEKVKRIEKRFEDAEKRAILEFCRQRDERANQLMDVLDQHTLRGVGANQDYMESVMQAVRRIAIQIAVKGKNGDRLEPSTDDIAKAKLVTLALARSSEQIVRTFHVADMLLNAADYEVSVANAKLDNADAAAFKRLRDAKSKEDTKLAADLEHRLGLIRSDTSRTQGEIAKLMALLGELDYEMKFDIAKERDKRMILALDEAKRKLERPPSPPEK